LSELRRVPLRRVARCFCSAPAARSEPGHALRLGSLFRGRDAGVANKSWIADALSCRTRRTGSSTRAQSKVSGAARLAPGRGSLSTWVRPNRPEQAAAPLCGARRKPNRPRILRGRHQVAGSVRPPAARSKSELWRVPLRTLGSSVTPRGRRTALQEDATSAPDARDSAATRITTEEKGVTRHWNRARFRLQEKSARESRFCKKI
jgi:hypothetical protein